jgi:hypothetical protein
VRARATPARTRDIFPLIRAADPGVSSGATAGVG